MLLLNFDLIIYIYIEDIIFFLYYRIYKFEINRCNIVLLGRERYSFKEGLEVCFMILGSKL